MANYNHTLLVQCLVLVTGIFLSQIVMSATVYQWIDEEGVVHFSDIAPIGKDTGEIEEIEFVDYENSAPGDNRYSISNQLERMTEWRRQLTEERLAQKQLQLEAKRVSQEKDAYRYNNSPGNRTLYSPVYHYPPITGYSYPGYFGGYKNFRHGHHFNFKSHKFSGGSEFKGKYGGHIKSRSNRIMN